MLQLESEWLSSESKWYKSKLIVYWSFVDFDILNGFD
jgi:hypothetical protein